MVTRSADTRAGPRQRGSPDHGRIGAPTATVGILGGVNLGKRRAEVEPEPEPIDDDTPAVGKGRPTPKRRDSVGARGPVSAPKTRKEAYARQKEMAKSQRTAQRTPAANLTVAQRRELLRKGDPSVLPRRDQGHTRKLARDYVDSRRMASNYLLWLFPLIILGYALPILQMAVLALFIVLVVEWFLSGRRIIAMSRERYGKADGGGLVSISFYAGSRAYLPRRWRMPAPQVERGDQI
jgi:hypothetical protein